MNNDTTPALMIQGTSSNAGKSILAAAFCRMLLEDGYRVAPFKAQNMSLNSFVTPDGLEIGRAQAVQAAACRLPPDVRMNPVLLKPTSDKGSQVVVMGKPVRVMRVKEYVKYKPRAFAAAKQAYDSLAAENQVMVLEGAGSPAEINLKSHDIVNMAMAAHARARVLLCADIDRGGVFASLVGTVELFEEWEKKLLSGFLINRFRGDASLLDPALEFTTNKTGKPFYGTIPHIPDLGLPEEDSVSFKELLSPPSSARKQKDRVEIALLDAPRISNFTDFDPLGAEPDVLLRIVRSPKELDPAPDCLILPGSKNTGADLDHFRRTGLAQAIMELAAAGRTEIVGVCGGFQMLGLTLSDPDQLERGGNITGLGLLPLHTVLGQDKILGQVKGVHTPSSLPVSGYEIHHGLTSPAPGRDKEAVPCLLDSQGRAMGYAAPNGRVWGGYLHGVFDRDEFRRWFIDKLRQAKGLDPVGQTLATHEIEPALARLAQIVRQNVDWKAIKLLLGLRRLRRPGQRHASGGRGGTL